MPQFDPHVAFPQIVWLIAVFAILYLIVRAALPKVERVVGSRAGVIGDDLNHAAMAKSSADRAVAEYEAGLAAARADAGRVTADAKAEVSADTAAKLREIDAGLAEKTSGALRRIENARAEAQASLDQVATDATADIVERLTGRRPEPAEAAAAVAA